MAFGKTAAEKKTISKKKTPSVDHKKENLALKKRVADLSQEVDRLNNELSSNEDKSLLEYVREEVTRITHQSTGFRSLTGELRRKLGV